MATHRLDTDVQSLEWAVSPCTWLSLDTTHVPKTLTVLANTALRGYQAMKTLREGQTKGKGQENGRWWYLESKMALA